MPQEIMTRKYGRRFTAGRGILASLLIGCCGLGMAGCEGSPKGGDAPVVEEDDKSNLLLNEGAKAQLTLTGGKVVEDGIEYEFGTTEVGQEFEHVFHVKNDGDGPVKLEKGPPSCGTCTSYEIDDLELDPGETATVTVKWKILAENPQFRQWVPVIHNIAGGGTGPKDLKMYVKGEVVQRIVIRPATKWDMGSVPENESLIYSASIASAVLDQFQISSITSNNDKLKITSTPLTPEQLKEVKSKSGYELKCELGNDVQVGEFLAKVAITVLTPEEKTLNVDVTAKRSGPLEIFGGNWDPMRMHLRLGAFDSSKDFMQRLNLYTSGIEEDLEIVNIKCDDDRFTAELEADDTFTGENKDRRKYDLFVKYKGSKKDALYPAQTPLEMEIQTNVKKVEFIKLRIISLGALPE